MGLKTKFFTSLDKIYPETTWSNTAETGYGTMMMNERFSFQLAYIYDGQEGFLSRAKVTISTPLKNVQIRYVGQVPGQYIRPLDADHHFEKCYPGMFPDVLLPMDDNGIKLCGDGANALWITVDGNQLFADQPLKQKTTFPLTFHFYQTEEVTVPLQEEKPMGEITYQLTVLPINLPKQKTLFTQWTHMDCIAHWYQIDVFSEEWWTRVEQYLKTAIDNGVNLVFVPLFTPPLDTAIGHERLTVQLVKVIKTDGHYTFNFTQLKRWLTICRKLGVKDFEFSHLFSQWGAKYAPKIVADVDGHKQKIFGWETLADSPEYRQFLNAFLPTLWSFLGEEQLQDHCFFHISDEPDESQLASYQSANHIVRQFIPQEKIMDAISNYAFYEKGLIGVPVCATDAIKPFLQHQVSPLFAYYCSAQKVGVANRFFGMPQVRNRCIGIQIYANQVQGFLHWGYNYWLSYGSIHPIDPFLITDCERIYPSGDCFSVYPSKQGPLESTRLVVFHEALQDIRLFECLEDKCGKKAVEALLKEYPYTAFDQCPQESSTLLRLREKAMTLLEDLL